MSKTGCCNFGIPVMKQKGDCSVIIQGTHVFDVQPHPLNSHDSGIKHILRNPGRDISFPIFIRKEIETRKLERKSKQKISRLIDLLYRLHDIISR